MDETEATKGPGHSGAEGPARSRALERAIDELRADVAPARAHHPDRRRLSSIIRRIVHQARADGLPVEQLVTAFRKVWDGTGRHYPGRAELRAEMLVAALITAFYEEQAAPGA